VKVSEPFQIHATTRAGATGAGDVTFEDGLVLEGVDPEHFPIGEEISSLAATRLIGLANDFCFLDEDLDGLCAFSPEFDLPTGESYAVSIPNNTGLADGAMVDLYVLGGLSCTLADGSHVTEGELVSFGTGTVSGDVIESNNGVPCVGWLGYKAQ
jgi:hypothetical protein